MPFAPHAVRSGMRLVLDTNVVVSAAIGAGAPTRLIELATEGEIELVTSAGLLAELAEVLGREHLRRRLASRRRSSDEVIALYGDIADLVVPASISPRAPDPDDDEVLGTALAASVDLIVSGDKPLRDLKTFHRIPIRGPVDAIAAIGVRA
jgi:putative PIN family toxin of toxin-antitoxin system